MKKSNSRKSDKNQRFNGKMIANIEKALAVLEELKKNDKLNKSYYDNGIKFPYGCPPGYWIGQKAY